MKKIALIECCNFVDYPTGGHLTFAKNMVSSFGQELVLIGLTTEKGIVGKWSKLKINGIDYDYFPYLYLPKESNKPLIPLRLRNYLALRKHKHNILKAELENVLTQTFETVEAIQDFNFNNICYRFAGTENPLGFSRYKIARLFALLYDKFFLPKLSKINLILAAANHQAIDELIERSKGHLDKDKIKQFPTRVNTKIFHKIDKITSRSELSMPKDRVIIVTTGRLSWFKGWRFMIDSFVLFQQNHPMSHFYIIGNGEDKEKISSYISRLELECYVHLVGFKNPIIMAQYLNSADIFIMGSFKEGWSTSLIEAVSCGTPACVTNFSSAKEILEEGITGYVAESHDEIQFVDLMNNCLIIDRSRLPQMSDIDKYDVKNLKQDLLKLWTLV